MPAVLGNDLGVSRNNPHRVNMEVFTSFISFSTPSSLLNSIFPATYHVTVDERHPESNFEHGGNGAQLRIATVGLDLDST